MTVGERIKAARKEKHITQKQLAEKLGISDVGVAQWETGRRSPKVLTVKRIAEALAVNIETLIPDTTEKPSDVLSTLGFDSITCEAIKIINSMNMDGRTAALRNVRELAEIPRYKK